MIAVALVAGQFVLIAALALTPRATLWPVAAPALVVAVALGVIAIVIVAVALLALGPALTASPVPRGRGALVTTGLYGVVRHPVYTGLLLGGVALTIIGASWWHVLILAALVLLLMAKARWEERMLLARYPQYRGYAARVGRFLPGIGKLGPS